VGFLVETKVEWAIGRSELRRIHRKEWLVEDSMTNEGRNEGEEEEEYGDGDGEKGNVRYILMGKKLVFLQLEIGRI